MADQRIIGIDRRHRLAASRNAAPWQRRKARAPGARPRRHPGRWAGTWVAKYPWPPKKAKVGGASPSPEKGKKGGIWRCSLRDIAGRGSIRTLFGRQNARQAGRGHSVRSARKSASSGNISARFRPPWREPRTALDKRMAFLQSAPPRQPIFPRPAGGAVADRRLAAAHLARVTRPGDQPTLSFTSSGFIRCAIAAPSWKATWPIPAPCGNAPFPSFPIWGCTAAGPI